MTGAGRIGMVGLGNMGGAIAERFAATGTAVVGYDPDAAACARASAAGIVVAASAAEAIAGADHVLSSLPNPSVARSVWLGDDALLSSVPAGSYFVELSTIDPSTMTELAAAAPTGVRVVDCPVSGGPPEAREGRLALIVGASDDDFAGVSGFLGAIGGTVHHAGPVGAGKAVKLVNNIMSMTNVLVAAEAFSLGLAYGIDAQRLFDILSVSGGTSGQFVRRFPRAIAGDYAPRFALALGTKDLTLAAEFARQLGVPAPATAVARELYAIAEAQGFGADDHVALLKMYAGWSGTTGTGENTA